MLEEKLARSYRSRSDQIKKGKVVPASKSNQGKVKHINPPCTQNISIIVHMTSHEARREVKVESTLI